MYFLPELRTFRHDVTRVTLGPAGNRVTGCLTRPKSSPLYPTAPVAHSLSLQQHRLRRRRPRTSPSTLNHPALVPAAAPGARRLAPTRALARPSRPAACPANGRLPPAGGAGRLFRAHSPSMVAFAQPPGPRQPHRSRIRYGSNRIKSAFATVPALAAAPQRQNPAALPEADCARWRHRAHAIELTQCRDSCAQWEARRQKRPVSQEGQRKQCATRPRGIQDQDTRAPAQAPEPLTKGEQSVTSAIYAPPELPSQ